MNIQLIKIKKIHKNYKISKNLFNLIDIKIILEIFWNFNFSKSLSYIFTMTDFLENRKSQSKKSKNKFTFV